MVCFAAVAVASCGGIPPALPDGVALNHHSGTAIAPTEAIRISFFRPLDPASLPGCIEVARNGSPVQFDYSLEDDGYLLELSPRTEWPRGGPLTIRLGTEDDGLRFLGGERVLAIELTYAVEERTQ